jgi:hypothetical protein
MSHSESNVSPKLSLPVAADQRRSFPVREKQPILNELDENGDVVFRFKLDQPEGDPGLTLTDYYRGSLRDLLRIVRLYFRDQPLIVDGFAFLNQPTTILALIPESGGVDTVAPAAAPASDNASDERN